MNPRLTFVIGIFCMLVGLALSVDASYIIRDAEQHKIETFTLRDQALAVFDSLRTIKCVPVQRGWQVVIYKVKGMQ